MEEKKEETLVTVETVKEEPVKEKREKKVMPFLITTLNGMAYGLFATLIIGTIIATIGSFFKSNTNDFCKAVYNILTSGSKVLQCLTGAGIGIGIALALKYDPLKTVVLAAAGEIAGFLSLSTKFVTSGVIGDTTRSFQVGDPLTIYLVLIAVAVLMKLVLRKKTPVDILIVPLFGVACALGITLLVRFPSIYVTYAIQFVIDKSTLAVPFIMGIVIAVLMGMALTAPISSAAIAAMVFTGTGEGLAIASGAAIIGCCTQMVGFAVQARKDNNIGMVISIGIGTSMLEFKNILKKPVIWLPTIIASAVLGPISTCWLHIVCMGSSAGMGTAGLVGQIGTFNSMGNCWQCYVGIFLFEIVLPAVLVFGLDLLFRKLHLIKDGDLKV